MKVPGTSFSQHREFFGIAYQTAAGLKNRYESISCVRSPLPTWRIDDDGDKLGLCLKCFQSVWNLVKSLDECAKLFIDKVKDDLILQNALLIKETDQLKETLDRAKDNQNIIVEENRQLKERAEIAENELRSELSKAQQQIKELQRSVINNNLPGPSGKSKETSTKEISTKSRTRDSSTLESSTKDKGTKGSNSKGSNTKGSNTKDVREENKKRERSPGAETDDDQSLTRDDSATSSINKKVASLVSPKMPPSKPRKKKVKGSWVMCDDCGVEVESRYEHLRTVHFKPMVIALDGKGCANSKVCKHCEYKPNSPAGYWSHLYSKHRDLYLTEDD